MRKGCGPNIQFRDVVYLYIGLFVCILFKFVKILYFDDLVLKCYFLCQIDFWILWITFWMILYDGMVWNWIRNNVWTDVCCVLSIDVFVVTEISELHWWSKSHRLRYQVVRSWWGSSCTPRDIWDARLNLYWTYPDPFCWIRW